MSEEERHKEDNRIFTIRSGGQTGVDRAALDAALLYKDYIRVTGWCPKGRLSEEGEIPPHYPLEETPSDSYPERTEWNIRDSDATLILLLQKAPPDRGTSFTIEKAEKLSKHCKTILLDDKPTNVIHVLKWLDEKNVKILNVGGPRESNCPGIYEKAYKFMVSLIQKKLEDIPTY
ncbi:12334_t:CDS:1 [Acaulospora morrowiae]|uniref:12334_t:CDS:1 n=1 Tax=Acaulospora morrowiae TaxID=94023 RepID=A0A9N8VI88_9GLOM|nr:12334_t:CDS:1 [Acaulospora morrowiae]